MEIPQVNKVNKETNIYLSALIYEASTFLYRELEIRKSRRDGLLEISDAVSIYGHECAHEWMQIYLSDEPVLYLNDAILTPFPISTKLTTCSKLTARRLLSVSIPSMFPGTVRKNIDTIEEGSRQVRIGTVIRTFLGFPRVISSCEPLIGSASRRSKRSAKEQESIDPPAFYFPVHSSWRQTVRESHRFFRGGSPLIETRRGATSRQ